MAGGDDWTDPSIGYRWIKANVYGALVIAALGLMTYALGVGMGVGDPDIALTTKGLFLAAGTIVRAFSFVIWARLTAGPLARRLPGFPVRSWILLHILIGLLDGAYESMGWIGALTLEPDPDAVFGTALTVLVLWALLWGFVGSLQAWVLRKVARGVLYWIGYSSLGGLVVGSSIVVALYWPQTGWHGELTSQLIGAIMAVIVAIILLPALRRLAPRTPAESAAVPPAS